MSRIHSLPVTAALLVSVVVLGCKESVTEPADPLSMEEVEALYQGIFAIANDENPQVLSETSESMLVACRLGGQVSVVADVSQETAGDTTRVMTDARLDPERCVVESQGHRFTLDGNPSVVLEMTLTSVGSFEQLTIDATTTGGVDWELEDRSGTCTIDVTLHGDLDLSQSEPGGNATVSGTMCGMEVDFANPGA